jgi:hypothetical protein
MLIELPFERRKKNSRQTKYGSETKEKSNFNLEAALELAFPFLSRVLRPLLCESA